MWKSLVLVSVLALPLAAQTPAATVAAKSDTIKFSAFQKEQLLDLKTQSDKLAEQQNIILRTIIASTRDPKSIEGWTIQFTENALILVPPKSDSTAKPKKP